MAVALRLSRGGSKKRPFFRIVAADVRAPRDGRFLERLGTYNPMRSKDDPSRVMLNTERIKYWLSVGAKPTEKVQRFLSDVKLAEKPIVNKQTKQDKPRKKTLEKIKAKDEKLKSKQEMSNAAETASSVTNGATEKPVETTPPAPDATAEKPVETTPPASDTTTEKPVETTPPAPNTTAEKPVEKTPPAPGATAEKPVEIPSATDENQVEVTSKADTPEDKPKTSWLEKKFIDEFQISIRGKKY